MPDMLIDRTIEIPLQLIDADDAANPRKGLGLDDAGLDAFAARIRNEGQLESVTVREHRAGENTRFELIAGFRRFKAINRIGWKTIRADVLHSHISADNARWLAAIENADRVDLSEFDQAVCAMQITDNAGVGLQAFCERLGLDYTRLNRRVAWMRVLPEEIKEGWRLGDPRATASNLHRLSAMFPADAEAEWHVLAGKQFEIPDADEKKKKSKRLLRPSPRKLERLMEVVQASALPPDVRELVEAVVAYAQGATRQPPKFPAKAKPVKAATKKPTKSKAKKR